ncbi:MAG: RNA polymerase factor sigma-32 [Deltaproteobacteria bacterium]|nr:RNA polymerase factor sigma-32 [Deltaproteobacteria bacterium]MBI3294893.1 RNA polymerase factor sigma-32 [Deltaproteobacteria bacterium]
MPPPKKKKKAAPRRKRSEIAKRLRSVTVKPKSVSISAPDPLLASYLREVHKYPLLSREEEHETAIRYVESKDREALQKLVTSNLRFVVKIAYEYAHYRVKLLDLIQEGNMGLVKAVQDFNPYKEVRLTTYAVWWIRSYIQDAILKNYSLVKMGTTQAQKKLFYRLRKEQRELDKLGAPRGERVKLLAEKLDVTPKEVEEMDARLSGGDLSLNAPTKDNEKTEHIQNIRDAGKPADETLADEEQRSLFKDILNRFSQTLEGRDKVFFTDRLIAENPLTLEEIGKKHGVSKERARQIEEALKGKLKTFVEQNYPDYDLLMK